MSVSIKVSSGRSRWPSSVPEKSEPLEDGRVRHTMADGLVLVVPAAHTHTLHYQSTFVGSEPGDYYEIPVAFVGRCPYEDGFIMCWDYDKNQRRSYMLEKILCVIDAEDGYVFSRADLENSLPDG